MAAEQATIVRGSVPIRVSRPMSAPTGRWRGAGRIKGPWLWRPMHTPIRWCAEADLSTGHATGRQDPHRRIGPSNAGECLSASRPAICPVRRRRGLDAAVRMAWTPIRSGADERRLWRRPFVPPVEAGSTVAGAGFVRESLCGPVTTMPRPPRVPAANHIALDANGQISGLSWRPSDAVDPPGIGGSDTLGHGDS
jgi:hypothetical protein